MPLVTNHKVTYSAKPGDRYRLIYRKNGKVFRARGIVLRYSEVEVDPPCTVLRLSVHIEGLGWTNVTEYLMARRNCLISDARLSADKPRYVWPS